MRAHLLPGRMQYAPTPVSVQMASPVGMETWPGPCIDAGRAGHLRVARGTWAVQDRAKAAAHGARAFPRWVWYYDASSASGSGAVGEEEDHGDRRFQEPCHPGQGRAARHVRTHGA